MFLRLLHLEIENSVHYIAMAPLILLVIIIVGNNGVKVLMITHIIFIISSLIIKNKIKKLMRMIRL